MSLSDTDILLATSLHHSKSWNTALKAGIDETCFVNPTERDLWQAMCAAEKAGKRHRIPNFVTFAKVEGTRLLVERLVASHATLITQDIEPVVKRVLAAKRLGLLRIIASNVAFDLTQYAVGNEFDGLRKAIVEMNFLAQGLFDTKAHETVDPAIAVAEWVTGICEAAERKKLGHKIGISTGIDEVDECLGGGLRPHEFTIVAGRTGAGKTQFAVNLLFHALCQKVRTLFFSCEMTREQIMTRLFSRTHSVNAWNIRQGDLTDADLKKAADFGEAMKDNPYLAIFQAFDNSLPIMEQIIDRECRMALPPRLVIVDYAQILRVPGKTRDELGRLQEISSGLKRIVSTHPLSLVSLAQLNRDAMSEPPEINHIRGNDSFAHDCDGAILLNITEASKEIGFANLRMRKMRHGEERNVMVGVDFTRSEYRNLSAAEKAQMLDQLAYITDGQKSEPGKAKRRPYKPRA